MKEVNKFMKSISENTVLSCPICRGILKKDQVNGKTYKCEKNHSYDIAREGYVNLLISNQKRSKNPGDSKEMVLARIDFLNRNYYMPICNKINEIIYEHINTKQNKEKYELLDLGCGEGYYLFNVKSYLDEKNVKANFYGMDVSKDAVRYAAKANKECILAVGNNFHIPAGNQSLDCILSVFSPIDINECNRVLKDDGIFVRVLPRKNHLIQLRDVLYDKVNFNEKVYEADKENNIYVREENITFDITLNNEELISLLKMTPHYWKSTPENKEKLELYESMTITVDMRIGVFKKNK